MNKPVVKRFGPTVMVIIMLFFSTAFGQSWIHPFDFPQTKSCPQEVVAVVEIPAGSYIKYELDKATGHVVVDRFQSVPMVYPANYGVITQTLAGDGDNLDVLVFTRSPIQSGALISVRPIGILKMIDGGEEDDKVIAVPTAEVDPTYAEVKSVEDLPRIERERLEFFFRTYKTLPSGRKQVKVSGLLPAESAFIEISRAMSAYAKSKGLPAIRCESKSENEIESE
ncbi:MAG TPA: inorganic diphosphatase [Pyrinomonadaceae bacterium]|nr:inorganic diphosphatase [Pyrinomonadaceae bacterium]HMP64374.1 inorganic diphosphatase [Pyrinomonadaceae bacterium]